MEGHRSSRPGWIRGLVIVPLVLLGGLGLALAGLYALHHWTRARVQSSGADRVAFLDIDCVPPPGRARADFLREVRYQSSLPAELATLEPGLADRLAAAFEKHPFVARVERIEVAGRQIHVQLKYRTPVLAIVPADKPKHAFQVDGQGLHLGPVTDPSLPVYQLQARSTLNESAIRAAARTAAFLRPEQPSLRLQKIEGPANRLVLQGGWTGEVIWGHAPGEEGSDEAPAQQKRERLSAHLKAGGKAGEPFDVR